MENNNELTVKVTNKLQENKFTQLPINLTNFNQNYWISFGQMHCFSYHLDFLILYSPCFIMNVTLAKKKIVLK